MMRLAIVMLALGSLASSAWAQSGTGGRLDNAERRLNAIDPQPAGATLAQANDSQRLDAIERRLDALERRLTGQQPAQPPAPTAAVQLPGGAIQQVPTAAIPAPSAAPVPPVPVSYRALGIRKGLTEQEVTKLLGPPVKIRRGVVDVFFYSKDSTEPNVNFQYGTVIGWND
ncbi:MAG: hypothetical protein WDO24_08205 [Pseudomonadota bacterium]